MENNTLQIEITEQDENNGVLTSMRNKLVSFNASINNCCIYKVPEYMLKGYECFYQPLVMSIGPIYYKDAKLALMQEVKWIYLNCFLQHPKNTNRNLNTYVDYVRGKEEQIRKCYHQEFKLSNDEFVEMVVLDATFLVYCLLSSILFGFDEPLVGNNFKAQMFFAKNDLFRLENQIPYFVLKGIFHIAFGHMYGPIHLIYTTLTFISNSSSGMPGSKAIESIIDGEKITDQSSIEHLLDLQWKCCFLTLSTPLPPNSDSDLHCQFGCVKVSLICPSSLCNRQQQQQQQHHGSGSRHLSFTAKQLEDAGVTFVAGETDNPLDVTFANGILTISKLKIYDSTESHLRNLVYFEQCHYYRKHSYFIYYIIFLDQLIDTVEDVQVLVKNKILSNHLGSNDDVVNLFNNICKNVVTTTKNCYFDVSHALNCYASTHRHRWMAILRSKYFNHPWVILSVIAAFMLFVLTLLQTVAALIYK